MNERANPQLLYLGIGCIGAALVLAATSPGCDRPEEPNRRGGAITFSIPTPEPVPIFWIDSAGNLGLRGVVAVVPGLPNDGAKLPPSCRSSAAVNGVGTLTVCMETVVGKTLAHELGIDVWTSSDRSKKP